MSWNSLCRPGWPRTQKSACLCLLSAGIKGVRHHTRLGVSSLSNVGLMVGLIFFRLWSLVTGTFTHELSWMAHFVYCCHHRHYYLLFVCWTHMVGMPQQACRSQRTIYGVLSFHIYMVSRDRISAHQPCWTILPVFPFYFYKVCLLLLNSAYYFNVNYLFVR